MIFLIRKFKGIFSQHTARKQGGFTLIELLVVIAIIAVLAAVVLVALGNARTRSRDARRVSDLNNVALAMEIYADQASDALYPTSGAAVLSNAQWATLITNIRAVDILSGDVNDPLNAGARTYKAQHGGTTARSTYLIGADLETQSTASCASDYDQVGLEALATALCDENTAAGNCAGDESAVAPAEAAANAVDYCICSGPSCS